MIGLNFLNLEEKLKLLEQSSINDNKIKEDIQILRRDVNDLHSIILLRETAKKIKKEKRIVFIGTGQINENVMHTYIYFNKSIQNGEVKYDGELMFIACSESEYNLLKNYGFNCEIWQYQIELAFYLLGAKVCVFSSHLYSEWGNNLLANCVSEAIKVELWHGLPAKTIGASIINERLNFHFFVRLIDDCFSKKYICIQNSAKDVCEEYTRAFPNAKQYVTGDARIDVILNEEYRKEFLSKKTNKRLQNWINKNKNHIKIIYAPTYRETVSSTVKLHNKILDLLSMSLEGTVIAVKLHPGIKFSPEEKQNLLNICQSKGHILIDIEDEIYSTFHDFDAMITDYSSIRIDFAITGKPILLWQFDLDDYKDRREINPVSLFDELDAVSYPLSQILLFEDILAILKTDRLKYSRWELLENKFRSFMDGKASMRTVHTILDVMANH